ncbi:MAG TPA: hypothetical protein PKE49_10615 [Leptospiraceae bacterium]|jgi:hypothetical protein|nr:hypothetical protein [Leptospirales bacterium]HMU82163.1 hypothetical protein [Leptospiraceae bacterium]HMX56967.1 hypothetical protein [Leptospiraceae bacterium]HNE23473.1 hypothetical protein [Leptospiraceae bacterium]HNJ33212.1 hypothetical protein [Leptospiraceae bacterium]
MKSWEPDQEFERADFPRAGKKPKDAPQKREATPGREVKAWKPRTVSEAAATPRASSSAPAAKSQAPLAKNLDAQGGKSEPRVISSSSGYAAATLGAAILENLEATGAELRHLYWQKEQTGISSKMKIKVIIQKAGAQALGALKSVMTTLERSQMAEIVKTEADCDGATQEQICREFIARIRRAK